ncbi:MAG: hypothetical protein NWT00_08320 [Beijerinckiaceae bacterium]|nr:hypothetical protein [Beijerinckiaceae bacterium]
MPEHVPAQTCLALPRSLILRFPVRFSLRPIKYRLEYIGFRCVAGLIRVLPVERASGTAGWIWRRLAPLSPRHKRAMMAIAEAFPDKDHHWHEQRILEMWDNLGRVFAEGLHLDTIIADGRVELENPEALTAALAVPPRFVAASAHLGNWEVGASIGPTLGTVVCGIYQPLHNPYIENYIRSLRAPLYRAGLFPKKKDAGRLVMRAVRKGASLATMGDLRDWRGPKVMFFDKPAPSSTFPAMMARTNGIPLFAALVARVPEGGKNVRFRARLVQIPIPCTDDRQTDIVHATQALQWQFESFIREYPGQWMWAHRRWG